MKVFNKTDVKVIVFIFTILSLLIAGNLKISIRKGRDALRKNDMGALEKALGQYLSKNRIYPLSVDGKIAACVGENTYYDEKLERLVDLVACEWGEDDFEELSPLPRDPLSIRGRQYVYNSDGEHYQLRVSLESEKEPEYGLEIVEKNLQCGNQICNYSKGY